jgi:hypothetical protein
MIDTYLKLGDFYAIISVVAEVIQRPHKVLFNPRQVNFVRIANLITNVCITAVYQVHSQGVRQQKKPFSRRWWHIWKLKCFPEFLAV